MNLGHIITTERLSTGVLVIFDPQVGDKLVWDNFKKRIDISYGIKLYRVDNLYVNLNLVKGIVLKD